MDAVKGDQARVILGEVVSKRQTGGVFAPARERARADETKAVLPEVEAERRRVVVQRAQRGDEDEQHRSAHRHGRGRASRGAEPARNGKRDQREAACDRTQPAAARRRHDQSGRHHDHRGRPRADEQAASPCPLDRQRDGHRDQGRKEIGVPQVAVRAKGDGLHDSLMTCQNT